MWSPNYCFVRLGTRRFWGADTQNCTLLCHRSYRSDRPDLYRNRQTSWPSRTKRPDTTRSPEQSETGGAIPIRHGTRTWLAYKSVFVCPVRALGRCSFAPPELGCCISLRTCICSRQTHHAHGAGGWQQATLGFSLSDAEIRVKGRS